MGKRGIFNGSIGHGARSLPCLEHWRFWWVCPDGEAGIVQLFYDTNLSHCEAWYGRKTLTWSDSFLLVGGLEHFIFSIQLGMSSSQVTKSIIFQRGGSTTNQKRLLTIINHILTIINSILTIRVGLNHQPAKLWNAPGYSDPRLWTCKAGESLVPWSEPVS